MPPEYYQRGRAAGPRDRSTPSSSPTGRSRPASRRGPLGRPVDEIVDYAHEHAIDLIVIATHGRTGLAHVLLGSVAERIVREAPCPVLTIRSKTPKST